MISRGCFIFSICVVRLLVLLLGMIGICVWVSMVFVFSLGMIRCMLVLCLILLVFKVCVCVFNFLCSGSREGWMLIRWLLKCCMKVVLRMCM